MNLFADHGGFIFAAYMVTAVALAGLVIVILADGRRLRRRLAEMEARGIRRRSDRRRPAAAPTEPKLGAGERSNA